MRLPSNWSRLTPVEQTFVGIDLERVDRGLQPIAGLTRSVDALAQEGADRGSDPPFPAHSAGGSAAGSIWASTGSPLTALFYWMYEDGPGGFNGDCQSKGGRYCWGHRDAILTPHSGLVGGGGHTASNTTFEILPSGAGGPGAGSLLFSWSSELGLLAA